jgi:cytochrome P450
MQFLESLLSSLTLSAIAVAVATWLVGSAVYRLYLSPIAKFPGPKLAALTYWYEFYYDVIKDGGGKYTRKIEELHEIYGPIIRINPHELHIGESEFYNDFYSIRKLEKYAPYYNIFAVNDTHFSAVTDALHKRRRAPIDPFFTRTAVNKLQPHFQFYIDKLCDRLKVYKQTGEVLPLHYALGALSTDVASSYIFGVPKGQLEKPDWGQSFVDAFHEYMRVATFFRFFPTLLNTLVTLPDSIMLKLSGEPFQLVMYATEQSKINKERAEKGVKEPRGDQLCMMEQLFNSDLLPPSEKQLYRLRDEGSAIQGAALETVALAMTHQMFFILRHPHILRRLKKELEDAIPNPQNIPAWTELEKLPYLTAVIKEGLRMSLGTGNRLPRVNPNEEIVFHQWVIPRGTPVGMTVRGCMRDEKIFPNPNTFDPERWLVGDVKERERFYVPFSKGARMCLGMHFAYAEMYLTLASILRRFDLELYETTEVEMEYKHDFFAPQFEYTSKGLRVTVLPGK